MLLKRASRMRTCSATDPTSHRWTYASGRTEKSVAYSMEGISTPHETGQNSGGCEVASGGSSLGAEAGAGREVSEGEMFLRLVQLPLKIAFRR